jgi:glycosyltransferase involved in cell wall biosynthesis
MPKPPEISVIIPVFNGLPYLRAQVDALLAQEIDLPWEAVYVDNGSKDGSQSYLAERAKGAPNRIRLIDGSQQSGQVYARNRGAEVALGRMLAFNDQDDLPARDWLAELVRALETADAAGGFVQVTPAGQPPGPFSTEVDPALPLFFGRFPVALGTNFAIHRHVMAAVGGWQDLGVYAGEDIDLCIRLATQGFRLIYAPLARVIWRARLETRGVYKQGVAYGRADVRAYLKYRDLLVQRPGFRAVLRSYKHIVQDLVKYAVGRETWPVIVHKLGWKMGRLRESIRQRTIYL